MLHEIFAIRDGRSRRRGSAIRAGEHDVAYHLARRPAQRSQICNGQTAGAILRWRVRESGCLAMLPAESVTSTVKL